VKDEELRENQIEKNDVQEIGKESVQQEI